jgi:hypothetical protein
MQWSWLDNAFPWIGLAAAVVLLALLFGTRILRGETGASRWHDRVWLAWLGAVAYLLHNVEEYGVDLFGRRHAFPDALCAALRLPAYPGCPIPPAFFLAVNLSLFWVAAPIAALLARRHPLVGFSIFSVIFVNALAHLVPLVLGVGYTPGTLSAALLFVPLAAWVARARFGTGRLTSKAKALLVANGIFLHVVLIGSVFLLIGGALGAPALVLVQLVNAGLFLLVPWLEERWMGGLADIFR